MQRIAMGTWMLLGLGLAVPAEAQSPQLPAHSARVLNRTYAAVQDDTASAESDRTAKGLPGNFPSLNPRSESSSDRAETGKTSGPLSDSLITIGSSLIVVLGLFAGLVWMTRRFGARSMQQGAIPKEVMQSLGSSSIDARTSIMLVRCGSRILVLARTAQGVQPISEVTDPNEVRHLTALCLGDSKKDFASTLQTIEKEKTAAGFVGAATHESSPPSRSRLFTTA